MLLHLYVFIIITTIVQINECQDFRTDKTCLSRPIRKSIFPMDKRSSPKVEVKFFETVSESGCTTTTETHTKRKHKSKAEVNFSEIKGLLSKLLEKLQDMEKDNDKRDVNPSELESIIGSIDSTKTISRKRKRAKSVKKKKRKEKEEKRQRWGKWTDWSPCSVSCGKGREIRWRHCLENCEVAETEMEEKTCQLPACGPSKLFGVIKL